MTNDLSQDDSEVVEDVYKLRWPIETFHRELKQTTEVSVANVENDGFKETTFLVPISYGLGQDLLLRNPYYRLSVKAKSLI